MARYTWTDHDHSLLMRLLAARPRRAKYVAADLCVDYATLWRWRKKLTAPATVHEAEWVTSRIRELLTRESSRPKKRSSLPPK
jgi:hypothetical protein